MAGNTSTIELKVGGIAEIKKQLRELKGELASATDPQQMAELAAQAGVLSDRLKDANEKVAVFAAGSPFEQTNNALGLMGSQLMSMDFEGAAESAKSFALAAKGIKPDLIASSLKSLGTVVFQVGKAFMSVGLSLLTNPIFLIAAAITAIVAVIALLMNKLGLLKPILDAIGKVFGWIMSIIDGVIEGFKALTDWLGLTAHAAEESASRQIKANQAVANSAKKLQDKVVKDYEQKIELAKIDGEDTKQLEAEKRAAIIQTSEIRYKALKAQLEQNKISHTLTKEEIKGLMDGMKEAREMIAQAKFDNEKARHQDVADAKKTNEEKLKQDQEAAKKAAEIRAEAARKRKEEEAKRLEEERKAFEERKALMVSQMNELDAAVNTANANRQAREDAENQASLQREAEYNALKQSTGKSKFELELQALEDEYSKKREIAGTDLQLQFQLQKEYTDKVDAMREEEAQKELERKKKVADASIEVTRGGLQGVADLVSAFAGKSLAAQKKAFETNKKLNIAMATIDTIKGAVSAFTGMVSSIPGPVGIVLGAVAAAGVVASGVANIKKISSQKFEGGGTASASTPSPVGGGGATSTQQASPNVSMFGQNNNANNLTSTQSVESQQQQAPVIKAVVVESDITTAQNKANKYKSMGEL